MAVNHRYSQLAAASWALEPTLAAQSASLQYCVVSTVYPPARDATHTSVEGKLRTNLI